MLGGSSQGEYDRGVNTFTPEGRILQIEYAINAINLGSTAVGVVTPHGVILGVERRLSSPLMDPESVEKMFKLDDHMGCAMSGLTCDARTLVDYAREKTTDHRFQFNEDATVASVTQFICDIVINFGESGKGSRRKKMSRPYGVALLVAGVDDQGPALFHTDPSGTFVQFKAKAVGSATDGAQDILDKGYHSNLTFEEGENLVVSTLKQVMEEKINKTNVELAVIPTSTRKWTLYDAEKVQAILDRIQSENTLVTRISRRETTGEEEVPNKLD